jgi:pimeloyl-ACP methyl ester carboxylesterase
VAAATLQPVTRGSVALVPCLAANGALQALCGTVDVYENRASRSGRKIALNVMILPTVSNTPAADAIFGFAGGPGQAATTAIPLASFIAPLRQERDVVLIDQRGTGKSNPLRCPFDPKDVRRVLERPEAIEQLSSCRAELEKVADLTQYNTANSSDDADEVRAALGYDRVNVVGGSYGSLAALDYLRRHEAHVRAVAIEGIVPPDYRLPLLFAKTIQGSLEHLFADCAADATCHKDFPGLKSEFDSIVKRLDRAPAQFDVQDGVSGTPLGITLSRGAFVTSLRPLLYQPGIVSQLPYILDRAYRGDWSGYASYALLMGRALEGDIARGMAFSVVCQESSPFISEQDIRTETSGTYLGDYDLRIYQKRCGVWPKARAAGDFPSPIRSAVPTLLIAGDEDPATPTWTARHAAEGLQNSLVVGIPYGTHATSAACIDRMIVQFIGAASTAGLDTACVKQIRNPPFLSLEQVARLRAQAGH